MKPKRFSSSGPSEQHLQVVFDDQTFRLTVKRDGVRSAENWDGLRPPGPSWAGLRWHFQSEKNWTVETRQLDPLSLHKRLGGTPVAHEVFPTKEAAVERANELLSEWGVHQG